MAFFDDMNKALESYPETNVVIEIIDFKQVDGNDLNVNENATFQVQVTNKGPLNLTDVKLRLTALNDALLVGVAGSLVPEKTSAPLQIHGGGGSRITETFTLKAPPDPTPKKQAKTDLLKVTLDTWDANLDRILIDNSKPLDSVNDVQAVKVIGD